jgi:acetoin:2,6-dichlorophenolindophenol oxidoreductase subunit beta
VTTELHTAAGENGDQAVAEPTEKMSMAQAMRSALAGALADDPSVILLGEDIADPAGGVFKVTAGLSTEFGKDRVRATPIAEQAIVGAAIGAAIGGLRPVAEVMFFDFMTVCMDQVVNHAAKLRYMSGGRTPVPITIRTIVGGGRFGAQHTQSLEALFMHIPGLKVVMPSTAADAKGLLTSCIADDDPCLFIEHMGLIFTQKEQVPVGHHEVPLGVAAVRRHGDDLTIVTYGAQILPTLLAAARLAEEGINAEVIDLRSLVPLDLQTVLGSVSRTKRVLITHAATQFCGPGAEVAARISEELFGELRAPVARLGGRYVPNPFSSALEALPTADEIVDVSRQLVHAAGPDRLRTLEEA